MWSSELSSIKCLQSIRWCHVNEWLWGQEEDQRQLPVSTYLLLLPIRTDLEKSEAVTSTRQLLQLRRLPLELFNFFLQLPHMWFSLRTILSRAFLWFGFLAVFHHLYFSLSLLDVFLEFCPSPFESNLWEIQGSDVIWQQLHQQYNAGVGKLWPGHLIRPVGLFNLGCWYAKKLL